MATKEPPMVTKWLENCGGVIPRLDLQELKRGINAGLLNEQDEYGMTALCLAVMSNWKEGVEELLRAGADTELYDFRTGATALLMAVQYRRNDAVVAALVAGGANPDAPNHWGVTPRSVATFFASPGFDRIPPKKTPPLPPRIQNAEHLEDHYHPRFKIPDRAERESLKVGQAVNLYVYGPKSTTKQDTVKVRITAVTGERSSLRYTGTVETPIEETNLAAGTTELHFGPENIATVFVPRPTKKKARQTKR